MIEGASAPRDITAAARHPGAPVAIQNVLRVLAAELARRRGMLSISQEIMADCSNLALSQLWDRWFGRWHTEHRV